MNRIFRYILIFQLLFISIVHSQSFKIDSIISFEKVFSKEQGFNIYNPKSMVYDHNDYLWISGKSANVSEYKLGGATHLIQRFDGSNFETIPLPETNLGLNQDIFLTKRDDGNILIVFSKNQDSKLYLLHPETVEFEEVTIPNTNFSKHDIGVFTENKNVYIFDKFDNNATIYSIDKQLNFTPITTISTNHDFNINALLVFKDYIMVNDLEVGIKFFSKKGNPLSINLPFNESNKLIFLQYWFYKNEQIHIKFTNSEKLFKFDPKNKSFTLVAETNKTYQTNSSKHLNTIVLQDSFGNTAIQNKKNDRIYISKFSEKSTLPDFTISKKEIEYFVFTSRDLQKELVITNHGKLYFISFSTPYIKTFLNNLSIRGMLQVSKNKILIASENKGWFVYNSKLNSIQKFNLNYKNKPFIASTNRGVFEDKNGFWSSDDKGILHINKNTHNVTPYYHYRINTLTQDDAFIYYASSTVNKLMKFNKKTKEHIELLETETVNFQKIIQYQKALYVTTNKGLLVYKNGKSDWYKIKPEDNFLLTITYDKYFGLLVGTKSGKVFVFNPSTKTFTLLYSDTLEASIATILVDNKAKIWLNTFGGIVAFNPKNKTQTRFSNRDGLSYFEANRYSALKTNDGHFLVGTLRGVNYFHPDSLLINPIKARLRFSSITYYQESLNKNQTIFNPITSAKNNTITLPVNHRNIELKFGLTGVFNISDLEYRYRFNKREWKSLNNKNQLSLLSIDPGKQVLEIEALDFSKNKIGESIFISIFAKDHFYNKWWFYIIVLFAILTFLYLYLSRRRKKEKNKLLERENKAIKNDLNAFAKQLIKKTEDHEILHSEYEKLKSISVEKEDLEKLNELANSKILTQEDWGKFKEKFNAAYPNYLISLKNKDYKFTPSEVRLIILEKLDLTTEEIANMLGVSSDSIRKSRYRLRKKLNAPATISINDFIDTL